MIEYEKQKKQDVADFKKTFNTDCGKRVLDRLKKFGRYEDPLGEDIYRNEGKREVVLYIMRHLNERNDQCTGS